MVNLRQPPATVAAFDVHGNRIRRPCGPTREVWVLLPLLPPPEAQDRRPAPPRPRAIESRRQWLGDMTFDEKCNRNPKGKEPDSRAILGTITLTSPGRTSRPLARASAPDRPTIAQETSSPTCRTLDTAAAIYHRREPNRKEWLPLSDACATGRPTARRPL